MLLKEYRGALNNMDSKEGLEKYFESRKEDWQELLKHQNNPDIFHDHLSQLEANILSVDLSKT